MKLAIEFDLTARAVIVHWPWGGHSFSMTNQGCEDMTEALQSFAIESSRRFKNLPQVITREDLVAIRAAMEGVTIRKFGEDGKPKLPSLDELLSDDDFFMNDMAAMLGQD